MKRRNTVLFPALMSGAVALALLLGFWLSYWRRPAPDDLPLPPLQSLHNPGISGGSYTPTVANITEEIISVSAETVQAVLKTISRPENYTARYVTTWHYNSEQSSWRTEVYALGDAVKIETLPGFDQPKKHYLTDGKILCYWDDGSPIITPVSVGERNADNIASIPTYESILDMDKDGILNASYESYDGRPYIVVLTSGPVYDTRWWISLDTALMHRAEQTEKKDGSMAISVSMDDYYLEPPPDGNLFNLPDGRPFRDVISELGDIIP